MSDLRVVTLFGKTYWWHKPPGQPLELVPHVPPPEPPERSPAEWHEYLVGKTSGMLPGLGEETPGG